MDVVIKLPRPYPKQKQILEDNSRFKVLCLGRRSGKTTLLLLHIVLSMLKGKRVCLITPEYGFGEKLFLDILNYIPDTLIKLRNKSKLNCELVTKGSLSVFSGEALHRVRGYEFDELCVDEAAYIDDLEQEWNLALRPLLIKTRGNAIFTSTPRGKNFFYSLFDKGLRGEDGFKSWQFPTHDNPHIPKDELELLISTMPQANYNQEILAIPGENADNPFGTDNIRNCIHPLSTNSTIVYGIDFGKTNDYTVITGQDQYGKLSYYHRFREPWEKNITIIKELRSKDPYTPIYVDSTGVGNVLLERLQAEVYNVVGFVFTSASKPMIMHDLIKDIEGGFITINEEIANEMNTFIYKYSSGGNIQYTAQSGYHDDGICSLAICNHHRKKAGLGVDTFHIF